MGRKSSLPAEKLTEAEAAVGICAISTRATIDEPLSTVRPIRLAEAPSPPFGPLPPQGPKNCPGGRLERWQPCWGQEMGRNAHQPFLRRPCNPN